MVRHMPSIQALVAFQAVARSRSFTKAGAQLCLTHGAISHRVKLLEAQLGVALFLRSAGAVTLTDSGERLLEAVSAPLEALADACNTCRVMRRETIRVSVSPAFCEGWLLSRLTEFRSLHPDLDVDIRASYELVDFESDDVDLAIRYGQGDWSSLVSIELMKDSIFPACSPDYAERLGGFSTDSDVCNATLLRFRREPWKRWFEAAGLDVDEPNEGPQFNDYNLLLQAAILGHGVVLARSTIAWSALAAKRLVRLSEITIPSQYAYFFVCPPQNLQRPAVDSFSSWLRTAATLFQVGQSRLR
jgi:LysR family glycine cleavage system transcriptional activator